MRASVIVPLFNKAPYVRRCLDSIAAQTTPEFEVIVVDDGSTDSGAAIAASYPDRRFRLVRQVNAGPGAARNRGIAEARAEVLAFLDADDVWLPEYLQTNLKLLDRHGPAAASVTSGYIDMPWARSSERLFRRRGIVEGLHRVHAGTPPVRLVHMLAYMSPCTTMVRRAVARRWGGYHEGSRYGEDATLWLKVLLNEGVCFHLRPLARFHRDASALSSRGDARAVEPFLLEPDAVAPFCPEELLPLLRRFYAIRACKTAAVLGYWGRHDDARRLFRQFVSAGDYDLPFFFFGLAGCTPATGLLGSAWRRLARVLQDGAAPGAF